VTASQPAPQYDTTVARPIQPRDALERMALERGADFRLVDRLMDERTRVPEFDRQAPPPLPADGRISDDVAILDDKHPFPNAEPLASKEASIHIAIARSTYRTHDPEEVLAAVQPFIDLEQREVNVRGDVTLFDKADGVFFALSEGKQQMAISHIFDYLVIRDWFGAAQDNGSVLLGVALPAHPRSAAVDRGAPGIPGTAIEMLVRKDAPYRKFNDLKGTRLALAANDTRGPGTFLTHLLGGSGQPLDQRFFGSVKLRRYPKDAVIDLLRGRADAACVSQGTMAALERVYGLDQRVQTLAVSPRYNLDVLYTSLNNVATHRTEIELTQRQLTTLRKDPEGQEVLFFFDENSWVYPKDEDLAAAKAAFDDFLTFKEKTPVDLKPLLDPNAPVDLQTYRENGDD